jgi:tetratricopeptide (TPR) repeat protein
MTFSSVEYYSRVLVFLIFLGLIVYALKKNRTVFFWLSFFLLALLPTLNPLGISWIVAERYAYLGAVGIFIVIAITVKTIIEKIELSLRLDRTVIFYVILGLLLTPLTVRTIARNNDWKNQDTLWLATAKTSPSSPQNHNNLGDLYGRRGDLERSAAEFQKAIELNPEYADAYHNLGNTYWQMGEIEEAIECFRKAAELKPSLWQSCQNLAAIYFEQGNLTAAKDWMEKAVAANPTDPNLQRNLEIINAQLSSPE